MSRVAIYPGTFDPITNGHVDMIERALQLFDKIVVAIAPTTRKMPYLSLNERLALITEALARFDNVRVATLEGLLVDFAKQHGAEIILRGLRNALDCDYELQLAHMNQRLMPKIKTVFLPASEKDSYISASIVREIISVGGDISVFVPPIVAAYLKEKNKS